MKQVMYVNIISTKCIYCAFVNSSPLLEEIHANVETLAVDISWVTKSTIIVGGVVHGQWYTVST